MSIILRQKLSEYDIKKLQEISKTVGIKNPNKLDKNELLNILCDVFETLEEFEITMSDNTNTENFLSEYSVGELRKFYSLCFSDITGRDIRTLKKDKLIKDLKEINNVEDIIKDYKISKNKDNIKAKNDKTIQYLNKLNRNYQRILCKNLGITNYKNMKKSELSNNIYEIVMQNDYTNEDIDSILKGKNIINNKKINKSKNIQILDIPNNEYKYIIHISDLHIRRNSRIEEYNNVFNNFYEIIKEKYEVLKDRTLVVCCGDIFHYKTTQRAEGLHLWNVFVKNVTKYFPFLCIIGNHDVDLTTNDIDWIKPLDGILDNFFYLKNTGLYQANNIIFGVSSLINGDILTMEKTDSTKKYIQLYHGGISGHSVFNGKVFDSPYKIEDFGEYDLLLLGDIHKFQYLNKEKTTCYSGSLIQQNKGESIYNHGFVLWNTEDLSSEFIEVPNPYCFLKVNISEDKLTYDRRILDNKKYLYVSYIIDDSKETECLINTFEEEINKNNISIIRQDYDKCFDETEEITNIFSKDKIQNKKIEDYIKEKLESESYESEKIMDILNIHNSIMKNEDIDDIYHSKWFLKELKFKNIFSYGNNIENEIIFDESGFYKIFGQNFLGKSSILNMIKWVFFEEESGINNFDILYKGKNIASDGYIYTKFSIGKYTYELKKDLIKSSKKCGYDITAKLITYENNQNINEIHGEDNIKTALLKLIGSYKQFELIASINNSDMGILKEKKILTVFNQLFKLDSFVEYEEKVKEEIKTYNAEIKSHNNELKKYNENYTSKIKTLKLEKKRIKTELSEIKLESEKKINDINDLIITKQKKLSKIILKTENPVKNIQEELKILQDKYSGEMTKNIQNMLKIDEYKTTLKTLENKIEDYTLQIKNLNKSLHSIDDIDISEIKEELKTEEKEHKELNDKIDILNDKINKNNNKINNLKIEIVSLSMDEDELLENISKQTYNYKEEKEKIILRLNDKKKLNNNERKLIISLLLDQDYHSLLETLRKNENIEDNILNLEKKCKLYKRDLKILEKKLQASEMNIYDLNNELKENIKNEEKHKENEKNNKLIDNLENNINNIKKEIKNIKQNINDINDFSFGIQKMERELEILKMKQEKYNEYILAVQYNEKYKNKHNEINTEIQELNNKLNNLKIKNMDNSFKKKKLELDLKNINEIINDYMIKSAEYKKINLKIIKTTAKLNNLKIYKNLINEKGIPSIILEDKIPVMETEINKILDFYTNFKIKIVINGNGSRKKIDIFQLKNNDINNSTNLTINSCSGYEVFILNIAFKLSIKKFCYINYPSFICIDEVWEKISEENYSKLHKIFDLLRDNYKNILVISHIDQIKTHLEDNYSGKYINIVKDLSDNYSFLK